MKNLFPKEIANAIDGADDELRQNILSMLILKEKATYSTIKNTFRATNGNLNHHLSLLIADGLLAKTLEKENGTITSYYRISKFGKQFVNCLFDSLKPKPTIPTMPQLLDYNVPSPSERPTQVAYTIHAVYHLTKLLSNMPEIQQNTALDNSKLLKGVSPMHV